MSTAKVISWCDLRSSYCDTKRYSNQWRTRGHTRILKMWQKIVFLKIHWRSMFSVCTYVIFSFTFFIILIFMPWTNSFFCHTISALIPNALKACFFCCFFFSSILYQERLILAHNNIIHYLHKQSKINVYLANVINKPGEPLRILKMWSWFQTAFITLTESE